MDWEAYRAGVASSSEQPRITCFLSDNGPRHHYQHRHLPSSQDCDVVQFRRTTDAPGSKAHRPPSMTTSVLPPAGNYPYLASLNAAQLEGELGDWHGS